MATFAFNPFARRQTPDSRFSHTTLPEGSLLDLVIEHFGMAKPGYREGVVVVPVPPQGFFTGTAELKEGMKLTATYAPRHEGEEPRLHVGLDVSETGYEAAKMPAKAVDIILYASKVLQEDGSNTLPASEGHWEVVSINARATEGEEPIHPGTLMANHFQESGGTATRMSDPEFVEALRISRAYWKGKISLG